MRTLLNVLTTTTYKFLRIKTENSSIQQVESCRMLVTRSVHFCTSDRRINYIKSPSLYDTVDFMMTQTTKMTKPKFFFLFLQ